MSQRFCLRGRDRVGYTLPTKSVSAQGTFNLFSAIGDITQGLWYRVKVIV